MWGGGMERKTVRKKVLYKADDFFVLTTYAIDPRCPPHAATNGDNATI